ncbi:MAG: flavodoxin [Sharpea porci]
MSKIVTYFSASGITKSKATELAQVINADLYEIEPLHPYTNADLNWNNPNSRSSVETNDDSSRPELKTTTDLSQYDQVYIGFPIWWGIAPRIINSFIEAHDLKDKDIILFATSGGSGIQRAIKDLQEEYPTLHIVGGKLLNGRVQKDII